MSKERHIAAGTPAGSQRRSNQGNFEQRDYSREYLEGFYEDVAQVDDEQAAVSEDKEPQQMALTDLMKQAGLTEGKE